MFGREVLRRFPRQLELLQKQLASVSAAAAAAARTAHTPIKTANTTTLTPPTPRTNFAYTAAQDLTARRSFASTLTAPQQPQPKKAVIVFSGLRTPHEGFIATIEEAAQLGENVIVIYPTNKNPDNFNPFSDAQRIHMLKDVVDAKKMKGGVIALGIPAEVWHSLRNNFNDAPLQWIMQAIEQIGYDKKDLIATKGRVAPNEWTTTYNLLSERVGLVEHAKRVSFATGLPMNSTQILSNLFREEKSLPRKDARGSLLPSTLSIIKTLAAISYLLNQKRDPNAMPIKISEITAEIFKEKFTEAEKFLAQLETDSADLKKRKEELSKLYEKLENANAALYAALEKLPKELHSRIAEELYKEPAQEPKRIIRSREPGQENNKGELSDDIYEVIYKRLLEQFPEEAKGLYPTSYKSLVNQFYEKLGPKLHADAGDAQFDKFKFINSDLAEIDQQCEEFYKQTEEVKALSQKLVSEQDSLIHETLAKELSEKIITLDKQFQKIQKRHDDLVKFIKENDTEIVISPESGCTGELFPRDRTALNFMMQDPDDLSKLGSGGRVEVIYNFGLPSGVTTPIPPSAHNIECTAIRPTGRLTQQIDSNKRIGLVCDNFKSRENCKKTIEAMLKENDVVAVALPQSEEGAAQEKFITTSFEEFAKKGKIKIFTLSETINAYQLQKLLQTNFPLAKQENIKFYSDNTPENRNLGAEMLRKGFCTDVSAPQRTQKEVEGPRQQPNFATTQAFGEALQQRQSLSSQRDS